MNKITYQVSKNGVIMRNPFEAGYPEFEFSSHHGAVTFIEGIAIPNAERGEVFRILRKIVIVTDLEGAVYYS